MIITSHLPHFSHSGAAGINNWCCFHTQKERFAFQLPFFFLFITTPKLFYIENLFTAFLNIHPAGPHTSSQLWFTEGTVAKRTSGWWKTSPYTTWAVRWFINPDRSSPEADIYPVLCVYFLMTSLFGEFDNIVSCKSFGFLGNLSKTLLK